MKKRKKKGSKQRPVNRKAANSKNNQSASTSPTRVTEIELGPTRALVLALGGIAAALTIFSSLQTLLDLADWASLVVDNWQWLLVSIWTIVFKTLGMTINPMLVAPLTFSLSMQLIALSALVLEANHGRGTSLKMDRFSIFFRLMMGLAVANMAMFLVYFGLLLHQNHYQPLKTWSTLGWNELLMGSLGFANLFFLSAHKRSMITLGENALLATLIAAFYFLVALPTFEHELTKKGGDPSEFLRLFVGVSFSFYALQMMGWLSWASPKFILFRLYIVLALVLFLVSLNFVSKLQFSMSAPL